MVIEFTVPGDPLGKAKLTRGQQWTDKAQNYAGYKRHVQDCIQPALIALAADLRETDQKKLASGSERWLKPISVKEKIKMTLMIHFGNEKHPDPSNVFGAIEDAIFVNDKHVSGSFDFDHVDNGKSSIDVRIEI